MKKLTLIVFLLLPIMFVTSCIPIPRFEYADIYHVNFHFEYSDGSANHRYGFVISCRSMWGESTPYYRFTGNYLITPITTSLIRHWFDESLDRYAERFDFENREVVYSGQTWQFSPDHMEELRQILESHNISTWNGFSAPANRDIHDSFFWIRAISRSGVEVSASGYVETPEGFDELFPILVDFFNNMAQKYILYDESKSPYSY